MKKIILLIVLVTYGYCHAQKTPSWIKGNKPSGKDSILYLFFDKGSVPPEIKTYSQTTVKFYKNGKYRKSETSCGYHKMLEKIICPPSLYYFGEAHFKGKTIDGYTLVKPDTVEEKEVKRNHILSFETLSKFLETTYMERDPKEYMPKDIIIEPIWPDPKGSESYWSNLKHIYVVESVDKGGKRYIITEVERDLQIE
ncbi:MAG: hypothetical protein KBF45_09610 [Cyclobacteriaceae bacterium]|jgi:hypothetical protein|nr:hypothetical protein [Cyclobacteriaceae bacterium]